MLPAFIRLQVLLHGSVSDIMLILCMTNWERKFLLLLSDGNYVTIYLFLQPSAFLLDAVSMILILKTEICRVIFNMPHMICPCCFENGIIHPPRKTWFTPTYQFIATVFVYWILYRTCSHRTVIVTCKTEILLIWQRTQATSKHGRCNAII